MKTESSGPFVKRIASLTSLFTLQLEGTIQTRVVEKVKGLRLDFEPADCVIDLWNLRKIAEGSYAMAGYWADEAWKGGLSLDDSLAWGGYFKDQPIKLFLRPYHPIE